MRPAIILSCAVTAQLAVLPAAAATYEVTPEGTGDFPTIQAAVDAVVDGDTIELTDGTFRGPGNRDIEFSGKAISVRSQSGDRTLCIIDCEASVDDLHRGFYFAGTGESGAELAGVTIANGFTVEGGGIYCIYGASPSISTCILANNEARQYGGAFYCDHGASPRVSDCVFSDNRADDGAGMLCYHGSSPTLTDCTFARNIATQDGGGLYCRDECSPELSFCVFSANSAGMRGGGMYCLNASSPLIGQCSFAGNSAGSYGGGLACGDHSSPEIDRCVFSDNTARDAAGIMFMSECSPRLYGCSFLNNTAEDRGGGVFCDGVQEAPVFSHCTFAHNSAASGAAAWLHLAWELGMFANTIIAFSVGGEAIYVPGSLFVPHMKCCDLFGNAGGDWVGYLEDLNGVEGNFAQDPLFCVCTPDMETSPYKLHANSPCFYENHPYGYPCGGLIGAHGLGCGIAPIEQPVTALSADEKGKVATTTWGRIKAKYGSQNRRLD